MVKFFNFQKLLVFFSVCGYLFAQDALVSGAVTDASGQPLPGVSVVIKDKKTGVQTDFDGNYKIEVVKGSVLVFSYVGMKSQEIQITDEKIYNVTLAEGLELQEVVVVGYGSKNKSTVTGSIASIKGNQLNKAPVANTTSALAGRIPGLSVSQGSSEPGSDGARLSIRGTNTFKNNSPMIVIDGVPNRGGLDRLNPSDIESITVLKDASAAIYGSRAANGVILVTTKKAKAGKFTVEYNYNASFMQPTITPEMMDAAQYLEVKDDLLIYQKVPYAEWKSAKSSFLKTGSYETKSGTRLTGTSQNELKKYRTGEDFWRYPNTNWYEALFKDFSRQERHTLQFSGGTEWLRLLASLDYLNQDALYRNSATGYDQLGTRVNGDMKINDYIKLNFAILARQENRRYSTRSAQDIFDFTFRGKPNKPAFWPNGKPGPDIEYGNNPVVISTDKTGYNRQRYNVFQNNGTTTIKAPQIKGLAFDFTVGLDKYSTNDKTFKKPWYLYTWDGSAVDANNHPKLTKAKRGGLDKPELTKKAIENTSLLLQGLFRYKRTFVEKHLIGFTVLLNRETEFYNEVWAYRQGYISDEIDQVFAGSDDKKDNGGYSWNSARMSYVGRFNYEFNKKYLFEFVGRYDGSYLFPKSKRFGFFPSFSAGWVLSEEPFMKNIFFINFLKLKGSYGQLGNDGVDPFQYRSTYEYGQYAIDGKPYTTLQESTLPNKDITWEVSSKTNLGVEAEFLDNRLSFGIEVFYNRRDNILTTPSASLPGTSGISPSDKNIGSMENRGIDFSISWSENKNEFYYSIGLNGQYSQNKLLFWDEARPNRADYNNDKAYQYRLEVFNRQKAEGHPLWSGGDTYVLYKYKGIFKDEESIKNNKIDYSALTSELKPGDMMFEDVNGDGIINNDDRIRVDKTPRHPLQLGLNFDIRYKKFDISMLWHAMFGGAMEVSFTQSGNFGNFPKYLYKKRWTIENPSDVHPRAISDRGGEYWASGNTYWLQNTDFLRLKNLQIGYTLPKKLLEQIHLDFFRIYLSGFNLLTFTESFFDPEVENSIDYNEEWGNAYRSYPLSKIINMGVNLKF